MQNGGCGGRKENSGNLFVFSCHGSMFMLFCIQDSDSLKIRREDKQTKRISSDGKEYRAGIVEEEFTGNIFFVAYSDCDVE